MNVGDFKFKVTILGNEKVGKTSLIKRYVYDKFDDAYLMTLGTKTTKKTIRLRGKKGDVEVKLVIWDIMGQREFSRAFSSFFAGSKGGILVCDLTRKNTLKNIPNWVNDLTTVSGPVPLIIVGNKDDAPDKIVTEEELAAMAHKYGAKYFLASAKTGQNVEKFFYDLAKMLMEKYGKRDDLMEFGELPKKVVEQNVKRRRKKITKAEELEKKEEFEKAKEIYDELEMWDYSKKVEFLSDEEKKVDFSFDYSPDMLEDQLDKDIAAAQAKASNSAPAPEKPTRKKKGLLTNQERLQLLEDRFLLGEIDKPTYDRLRKKFES